MSNVFWFTGVSCSGKTTLTKNLEKILVKDFSIKVIDEDEVLSKLGGREFRIKHYDKFLKKVVNLVENSLKQNELVLVAVIAYRQKQRDYAKKILGNKFHSVYLQCSDACIAHRTKKRIGGAITPKIENKKKKPLGIVRNTKKLLHILHILKSSLIYPYEIPKSSDLKIDTEKDTIDESVDRTLTFIYSKILEANVTEVLKK